MAKPSRSLLTPQPPLEPPRRFAFAWSYLLWAMLTYWLLYQVRTNPPNLIADWGLLQQPSLHQALEILRYALPALLTGLSFNSLANGKPAGFLWGLCGALTAYGAITWLSQIDPLQRDQHALFSYWIQQPPRTTTLRVLQYVLPVLWLVFGLKSRSQAPLYSQLFESVANPNTRKNLGNITWREFEQLVAETFRRQGFNVSETQHGADGGVDIILTKHQKTYLVQCKQWKAFKVGVNVVRELYGVMAAEGAAGGYVVTCGQFTDQARVFAKGLNLHLIDGAQLSQWISGSSDKAPTPPKSEAPVCPSCGAPMRKRTAKHGAQAGHTFWGCSNYPHCRGTRAG